jgi:hypothetical protein
MMVRQILASGAFLLDYRQPFLFFSAFSHKKLPPLLVGSLSKGGIVCFFSPSSRGGHTPTRGLPCLMFKSTIDAAGSQSAVRDSICLFLLPDDVTFIKSDESTAQVAPKSFYVVRRLLYVKIMRNPD